MNLAIVHYHLNRGGVARVIENQLLALDAVLDPMRPWRAVILHGGRKAGWDEELAKRLRAIDLQLVELPGLDYDFRRTDIPVCPSSTGKNACPPDVHSATDLANAIPDALKQLDFLPGQTVVQIHNHSLGKNATLAGCVEPLAAAGYAMLLQIHDFAEDFRPANYQRAASAGAERMYPQAAGIHYAVLNGRDEAILRAAGVTQDRLHRLPNPVPTGDPLPDRAAARGKLQRLFDVAPSDRFVLYPIRAIRRKNVGEALLAGLLSPPGTVVGVTLAPLSPAEKPAYAMWKETAAEWKLPCRFEVSEAGGLAFTESLAASDALTTTSLAEGFGMVMLESWPAGRALVGRDLPEITADFTEAGLRFDRLWTRLDVPIDWVGRERFAQGVADAYRRVVEAYGRPLPSGWQQSLCDKVRSDVVDFGDLNEPMQKDVLQKVLDWGGGRQAVFAANRGLEETLAMDGPSAAAAIEHNVRVIDERFSLVPSGRRLAELLARIVGGPRGGPLAPLARPKLILDTFLDPRRFRMIRG